MDVLSPAFDRWLTPDPMGAWDAAEVVEVTRARSDTVLRLRLPEVPEVLAGQYYLVRMAVDVPPGAVEQAYSLCSSPYPASDDVEIAVRAVPGGRISVHLACDVEVGDRLWVRGPFGVLTWTEHDGGPVGLVAAGSGVAPFAAIVRYAAARRFEIPMTLVCSNRDRTRALLGDELDALDTRLPWFETVRTYTRSPNDPSARYHRHIDAAMLSEIFEGCDRARRPAIYYVAGPGDMVLTTRSLLGSLGVADGAVYSEDHA